MLPHCSTLESGCITAPGSFRFTLYGVTRLQGHGVALLREASLGCVCPSRGGITVGHIRL